MPTDEAASKRGRNNKRRGSEEERRVAKILSVVFGTPYWRNPSTGKAAPDVESEDTVVEVKSSIKPPPATLWRAWEQVTREAARTGKRPLIILSYRLAGRRIRFAVSLLPEQDDEKGSGT